MVKIGRKEKTLCGGKLVVTSFKKLNPKMFAPLHNFTKQELNKAVAACTPDGKIYVNTEAKGYELAYGTLEILMQENRATLEQYEKEYGKKFPDIKDFDDWAEWSEKAQKEGKQNEIVYSFSALMIPIELKRRAIEKGYYGKIHQFPG